MTIQDDRYNAGIPDTWDNAAVLSIEGWISDERIAHFAQIKGCLCQTTPEGPVMHINLEQYPPTWAKPILESFASKDSSPLAVTVYPKTRDANGNAVHAGAYPIFITTASHLFAKIDTIYTEMERLASVSFTSRRPKQTSFPRFGH